METPTKEQLLASDLFYTLAPIEQQALLSKVDSTFAGFDVADQRRAVEALNKSRKGLGAEEPATSTKTAESGVGSRGMATAFSNRPVGTAQEILKQLAQYSQDVQANAPNPIDSLMDMGKKGALPTIGQVGGYALGAATRVPGAATTLGAGGSALGEYINQKLGITEESGGQIALAGAVPLAAGAIPPAVAATKRFAAKALPGAGAALRQYGIGRAEALAPSIAPRTASDVLYDRVAAINPQVDLAPLKEPINKLLGEEALATQGLKVEGTQSVAGGIKKELLTPKTEPVGWLGDQVTREIPGSGFAPFQQVRLLMRRLNAKIGNLQVTGGEALGDMLQMKSAFLDTLNQAADQQVGQAAKLLKEGNQAWGQELAQEKLQEVVRKNFGRALEGTELLSSRAAPALNQLDDILTKDPKLANYFPPGALDRIKATFREIADFPVRGAPAGADAGSKNILKRTVIGGGLGELIGQQVGLPPGMGGTIGSISGVVGADIISKALLDPKATKMLVSMYKATSGQMGAPQWQTLGAFLAAQAAETKKKDIATQIKAELKRADLPLQQKQEAAISLEY